MGQQPLKFVTSLLPLLYISSETFDYFRILGNIEMKFGQKKVQLMTNISNSFLVLLWRLEIGSKPFHD